MYPNLLYILVMAGTTYLIRVLPMTLIRKEIKNRFLRSFLYYITYVTLAVMTFPAIMDAAEKPLAGLAALIAGAVLAFMGAGLFPVAVVCCIVVFVLERIL